MPDLYSIISVLDFCIRLYILLFKSIFQILSHRYWINCSSTKHNCKIMYGRDKVSLSMYLIRIGHMHFQGHDGPVTLSRTGSTFIAEYKNIVSGGKITSPSSLGAGLHTGTYLQRTWAGCHEQGTNIKRVINRMLPNAQWTQTNQCTDEAHE